MVFSKLEELKLEKAKCLRIVTDGGSNMKSAFFEPFVLQDEIGDDEQALQQLAEQADIPENANLFFGLEIEADESAEVAEDFELIDMSMDFQMNEHFYCAAHRIQLTLKDVFDKNLAMKDLRKRIFAVIGKFSKSHLGTSRLKQLSGKKLLFPANTRWSSLQLTYKRVLDVLTELNQVAFEYEFGQISRADATSLQTIVEIITPFKDFTEALERASSPTISLLLPGIENLIATLAMLAQNNKMPDICRGLISRIRFRFNDVLESGNQFSDPVFLCASVLDPSVQYLLTAEAKQASRAVLREMAKLLLPMTENVEREEIIEQPPQPIDLDIQPKSPFGMPIVGKSRTPSGPKGGDADKLYAELDDYLLFAENSNVETDQVLNFWKKNENKYPILSKMANSILAIPATTSPVERMFSQLSLQGSGHKAMSGEKRLRNRILMSFNKKYIDL